MILTHIKTALVDFDGTLICVSHDRDFLDGLVSKVYEFGHGRVREHLCGIYEFLETKKLEGLKIEPSATAGFPGPEMILANSTFLAGHGIAAENITHILWTTGGRYLPEN